MKKFLLGIITLLVAVAVQAVPAYRGWQTRTLPDGTQITVRQVGDEFYHYWETKDGKQAIEQSNGSFVVSEKPIPSVQEVRARRAKAKEEYRAKQAIGTPNLAPRGLLILVNYSDCAFGDGHTQPVFDDMCNSTNCTTNAYEGVYYGSAAQYFADQSNGSYRPVFDVVGPVNLPNKVVYYGEQGGTDDNVINDLYTADFVIDAVLAADAMGCDFSKYDSDGDGYVDFVYFIYAGKGQAAGGGTETIWPHNWNLYSSLYFGRTHGTSGYSTSNLPELDGKIINNYACSAELDYGGNLGGIGTFCHEFGHVMGLPDLYDVDYGYNYSNYLTPGSWNIMDGGSYNGGGHCPPNYDPWEKAFFEWVTVENLGSTASSGNKLYANGSASYNAYQINSSGMYKNPKSSGWNYYLENRQQSGWDTYLPGHGMLIWKVNYSYSAWQSNDVNTSDNSPLYTVVPAYGNTIDDAWLQDEITEEWIYYPGSQNTFPGTQYVTSWEGVSGKPVLNIQELGGVITFNYIDGKEDSGDPPTATVLANAGYDVENNIVVCFYFDETVCNTIVFVGTHNNWSTSDGLIPLQPLSGYDGWYAAEVPYTENAEGKPIHLATNGSFNWDYQSGDVDAWVYRGAQHAQITGGFSGEANVAYPSPGAYVYEIAYFKNHNSPCSEVEQTVKVRMRAPEGAPENVEIIGTFDDWIGTAMTLNKGVWEATVPMFPSSEFKFREADTWDNQIQYYNDYDDAWYDLSNFKAKDVWSDASGGTKLIELDLSNSEYYRWTTPRDVPVEVISVAQAIEIASDLGNNESTDVEYIVQGYVINAGEFNRGSMSQNWYLSDDEPNSGNQSFQAYQCIAYDNGAIQKVLNGDIVQVRGYIQRYYNASKEETIFEISGGTAVFIYKTAGDHDIPQTLSVNVADALEIGKNLSTGEKTSDYYQITGYVSSIAVNDMDTYKNMCFWITDRQKRSSSNADTAFYVYRGKPERELHVGDLVQLTTQIYNYGGIIESTANNSVTILDSIRGYEMVVRVYAPEGAPDNVAILGSFNKWTDKPMTLNNGVWETTQWLYPTDEFKFREAGTWDNQIQYYSSENDAWYNFSNFIVQDYWQYTAARYYLVSLDFSNTEICKWTTPKDPGEAKCYYTIDMSDTYGDGWNDAHIRVVEGTHVSYASLYRGTSGTIDIPTYGGTPSFFWKSGWYDSEVGFTVLSPNGMGLFQQRAGEDLTDGQVLYTAFVAPCDMGANLYEPRNVRAELNASNEIEVTWDAVDGVSSYMLNITKPNGDSWYTKYQVIEPKFTTSEVTESGEYTISVASLDAEGLQLGQTTEVVAIELPKIELATLRVLVPSDCGMDVSQGVYLYWRAGEADWSIVPMAETAPRLYTVTIMPNAPSYSVGVINRPAFDAEGAQSTSYWSDIPENNLCCEVTNDLNLRYHSDCEMADHDYRVTNLKAVSVPGRVDFSWEAVDVAALSYIHLYQVVAGEEDQSLGYFRMENSTGRSWFFSEYYEGMDIRWSVEVYEPYHFNEVFASEVITLKKPEIEITNLTLTTTDSISLDLSWECNTDTVLFAVYIYYQDEYIVKYDVQQSTSIHFTAPAPAWYYCYVRPLNQQGEVISRTYYAGGVSLERAPKPHTDLQSTVDGRHITFSWHSNIPYTYAEIYRAVDGGGYTFLLDSIMSGTSLSYDPEEDGLYLLQLRPYVEVAPGEFNYLPVYTHTSAQVFTGKTYSVQLTATEGGYIFPEDLSGNYPEGYTLAISAYSYSGYSFYQWSDGYDYYYRELTVDGDISLQAIFKPYKTLTVGADPTYAGEIHVEEYYIYHNENIYTFVYGNTARIEAVPYEGYRFVQWSDGVKTRVRSEVMTENMDITAYFEVVGGAAQYTVELGTEGYGYGTVEGAGTYYEGEEVEISATPYDNSIFVEWSDGIKASKRLITVTEDISLNAIFNLKQYHFTLLAGDGGIVNGTESGIYEYGSYIWATATPDEHYHFTEWSDGYTYPNRYLYLYSDTTLKAFFAPNTTFSVKVASEQGGLIFVSGMSDWKTSYTTQLEENTSITIATKPQDGYRFICWSDGVAAAQRTIKVTDNIDLTARYERIASYHLNISASAGGLIQATGMEAPGTQFSAEFSSTEVIGIMAIPNSGYGFYQWSDGVKNADRSLVLTSDTTLEAQFRQLVHLTVASSYGGDVVLTGDYISVDNGVYTLYAGTEVQLEAVPYTGYRFTGWSDEVKTRTRTLTVTADRSLSANFEYAGALAQYTLTVKTEGTGNGTVSNVSGVYYEGETVEITATPASNSVFEKWSDEETANPRTIEITQDITLSAIFNLKSFTLTISATEGGSVNDTEANGSYPYGTYVNIVATPDPHHHLVAWSDGVAIESRRIFLSSDTNLVARFSIDSFEVAFYNYDMSLLERKRWAYGEMPSCSVTPTKPSDGTYIYTFSGWDPAITAVTANASYIAVFKAEEDPTHKSYQVSYLDWDDELIARYDVPYGQVAPRPEDPVRSGYEFTGWEVIGKGNLDNVQCKITAQATYKKKEQGLDETDVTTAPRKVFENGTIYVIMPDGKKYTVMGSEMK